MVFNVNNNGDSFKLPKIKLDMNQWQVGAGNPISVFGNQNALEESLLPMDFNLMDIQKEETDAYVAYTRNGIKTTFYKREGSDTFESIKYESEHFEDIKEFQVFYDENGNQTRRLEIFKDDHELATKEIHYKENNPTQPMYQKETFKPGGEYSTRETFYDNNGQLTIKTLCTNGDIIIQKPTEKFPNSPELIIPKNSFGIKDANIYIKDSKGNLMPAGNIFKNDYGINLDDLHLPKLNELSVEELRDFPENKLVIKEVKTPYGKIAQEIGCYKNGEFVSYALDKEGKIEERFYSINGAKDNLRLEHSKCGDVTTEYIYDGDQVTEHSRSNGQPFYSITTDKKGRKIKTYAYETLPFSRTYLDKNGNEVVEFYNRIKNTWMKDFPAQPKYISYTAHMIDGKDSVLLDKLKQMPPGTKVKFQVNSSADSSNPDIYRVFDGVYDHFIDENGNIIEGYMREYISQGSGKKCVVVYEVLPDYSAGRVIYINRSSKPYEM